MSNVDTGNPIAVVCPGPVKQAVRIMDLAHFERAVTADRGHPTHRFVMSILSCYPGSVAWIDVWPDADWQAQPAAVRFEEEKPPALRVSGKDIKVSIGGVELKPMTDVSAGRDDGPGSNE